MRHPVWMLSIALGGLLAAGAAAATAQGLTIALNEGVRVVLPGPAANVLTANPDIADVAVIDSHSVVVIGKGYGVTEVMATDHSGRLLMDRRVAVVGGDQGLVTVYRGTATSDYNCAGHCQALAAGAAAAAAPVGAPAATPAAEVAAHSVDHP